jgi:hypothetical protein
VCEIEIIICKNCGFDSILKLKVDFDSKSELVYQKTASFEKEHTHVPCVAPANRQGSNSCGLNGWLKSLNFSGAYPAFPVNMLL